MEEIIITTEAELKRIVKEALDERMPLQNSSVVKNAADTQEVITSLKQIAELFDCTVPTAQKIKNRIPKHLYKQVGRTFAIPKPLLLQPDPDDVNPHIKKET